jgi:hypothetical protein
LLRDDHLNSLCGYFVSSLRQYCAHTFGASVGDGNKLEGRLPETGLWNARWAMGRDVEVGQQPRFYFGGLDAGSREAIAPSESEAQELTAAKKESEPPLLLGPRIR